MSQSKIESQYWRDILSSIADLAEARVVVLSAVDLTAARFVLGPIASDPVYSSTAAWQPFAGTAPWLSHHRSLASDGAVVSTDDLMARSQLVQSPFYDTCLRSRDLVAGMIMAIELGSDTITWLHVLRSGSDRAFGAKEATLLRGMQPMLNRMLRILGGIDSLQRLHDSLTDTLEHLSTGVALISDDHVVCNQRAKDILAENDGLQLVDGRLVAVGDENAALQALTNSGTAGDMSIGRPSGKRAFEVSVRHLGQKRVDEAFGHGRVAVYIRDPQRRSASSAAYLRQAFDLTRAEADIATYLAKGQSLADIAEGLGITIETVRSHVKRILTKTDTSRQAELVALIANKPIN